MLPRALCEFFLTTSAKSSGCSQTCAEGDLWLRGAVSGGKLARTLRVLEMMVEAGGSGRRHTQSTCVRSYPSCWASESAKATFLALEGHAVQEWKTRKGTAVQRRPGVLSSNCLSFTPAASSPSQGSLGKVG